MQPRSHSRQALRLAALACAMSLIATPLMAEPTRDGFSYSNPRYGFSLRLPADVFPPEPSRSREEGAVWASRDGLAQLLAVAAVNDTGETVSSYRRFVLERSYVGAAIDYAPVRGSWFVISGIKDGSIFYERINFICEGRYIYGWKLTYPAAERHLYDRVVEAIHRSYRPGRGEDGRCGRTGREPS